ncbi:chromosomal replication initiator protein DnaA [Desulfatirhabdium butyrativorans]|uniref:chromosomal replication initiator protein DnaA n=1 Tax=Desulfatirhabdium butyrativorans TaxID=340467 RepID=UPI0003FA4215|nr:chromosomal replication initiator protein DnaA [Desulfatirhabdium butyrativorans]
MEKVWNQVKSTLKERVTESSYRMWIDPVTFLREEQDIIFLSTPNIFTKKRLQDHFAVLIQDEIQSKVGRPCRIMFEIVNMPACNTVRSDRTEPQLVLPGVESVNTTGRMLRNDFTFDEFVVGSNNDFAFSASLAMATRKKAHSENALLLIAKTGLGKSHLTQAVGNHILLERPQERVYYISAEDFSNEMVYAMRNDSVDQFKKKYRTGCDVLLLDDIHYLTGKDRTQIELAMTLDSLINSGKRIIFSSCCLPMEIPKLNDTLRSRLSSSIISPIDPPNFRTRVRILHKKAAARGLWVSEDVTRYLASELTEDIRQLESGLSGVAARASLMGTKIDMQLAENVIKNIVRQQKKITIDIIKKLVCAEFNVSMQDLLSSSRKQAIVRPRQIAMYLSRRYTDSPLQTIGKSFNRYHATAMHAIALVEKNLKENRGLFKQVEVIGHKLETGDF